MGQTTQQSNTTQTSGFLSLDWKDALKGVIVAVVSAVLTAVYGTLQAGSLTFNWKQILTVALTAAASYLLKNLFTGAQMIVKLMIPLLLLSSVCSAQSFKGFFEPLPKVKSTYHAYSRVLFTQPDSFITAIRPVAIAAAYGYESGSNNSVLMAGTGAGVKRLKYDYTTQKWISQYSFNLLIWAEGSMAPPLAPAFAAGPTVGLFNDNLMFGGAWDFTNKHPVFVLVYSIPTNN